VSKRRPSSKPAKRTRTTRAAPPNSEEKTTKKTNKKPASKTSPKPGRKPLSAKSSRPPSTKKRAPRATPPPPAKRGTSTPLPKKRKRETYKQRIDRLMGIGYTRSQARGHAKKGEVPIALDRKTRVGAVRKHWTRTERQKLRKELLQHFGNDRKSVEDYIRMLGIGDRMVYVFMHY
jgi:hypothetical protein